MSGSSKAITPRKVRSLKQIEVLVVQSNPADSLLTVVAFKTAGLTNGPRCVREGEQALMYVLRKGQYADVPIPDLIFLDLSQPTDSALEVLKVIKSTPSLMHIPVVVAAGSGDPKFVSSVYALNANCFVRKPVELDEFVRFIQTCYQFWGTMVTLVPSPPKTPKKRLMASAAGQL